MSDLLPQAVRHFLSCRAEHEAGHRLDGNVQHALAKSPRVTLVDAQDAERILSIFVRSFPPELMKSATAASLHCCVSLRAPTTPSSGPSLGHRGGHHSAANEAARRCVKSLPLAPDSGEIAHKRTRDRSEAGCRLRVCRVAVVRVGNLGLGRVTVVNEHPVAERQGAPRRDGDAAVALGIVVEIVFPKRIDCK